MKHIDVLLSELPAERRQAVEEVAEAMIVLMQLAAVREARSMTQVDLANVLRISQPAVSKIERRSDIHLSTLNRYVRALGGQLRLEAVFPDQTVDLSAPASE